MVRLKIVPWLLSGRCEFKEGAGVFNRFADGLAVDLIGDAVEVGFQSYGEKFDRQLGVRVLDLHLGEAPMEHTNHASAAGVA